MEGNGFNMVQSQDKKPNLDGRNDNNRREKRVWYTDVTKKNMKETIYRIKTP